MGREATRKHHVIEAAPDCEPEIGRALGMLEDARRRTRRALKDVDPAAVDWVGGMNGHSIGTLLYHIAAVELDWLYADVLQQDWPEGLDAWFPHEVRDAQGHLTMVRGETPDRHWARLDRVRSLLLEVYKPMSVADFRRPRQMPDYIVTPEWVLHHLCQHEAEHRDEIATLRAAAEKRQ